MCHPPPGSRGNRRRSVERSAAAAPSIVAAPMESGAVPTFSSVIEPVRGTPTATSPKPAPSMPVVLTRARPWYVPRTSAL